MKRAKPKPEVAEGYHHNVYVVLLDSKVAEHPSVRRLNPRRDPANKNGHKAAWTVKRYGVRLLPELYACFNPMPFHAAAEMEQGLAEDLRAEGYTVTGGK